MRFSGLAPLRKSLGNGARGGWRSPIKCDTRRRYTRGGLLAGAGKRAYIAG
jgi:hypothetical protein